MKNIVENNKVFAEFLGYSQPHPDYPNTTYWYKKDCQPLTILLFHSDWNWLMSVVDKIESIIFNKDNSFNVTIGSTNFCVIQDSNGEVYESIEDYRESKLLTTYVAVTEFIKWYNEQLKENEGSTN